MECLFIVARCGVFIYSSAVWSVIVPVHCKREETPICVFAEILLSIWLAELLRGPFPPSFLADVDECRTEANDCDFNARCYNTEGSFECRCNPGYRGDGRTCQREYAHLVVGGGGGEEAYILEATSSKRCNLTLDFLLGRGRFGGHLRSFRSCKPKHVSKF